MKIWHLKHENLKNDENFPVSKVYHSMFNSTKAILLSKNLTAKTSAGLLSVFGETFIKKNILPKKL